MRTLSQISGLFALIFICASSLNGQGTTSPTERFYSIDSLCFDEIAIYHGFSYDQVGSFSDTLKNTAGIDSLIVHVTIGTRYDCDTATFPCNETDGSSFYIKPISMTLCEGETMHMSSNVITGPGVYEDTIYTATGICDTILLIDVDFSSTSERDTQVIQILNGQSHEIDGETFTSSAIIDIYFSSSKSCDSIATTILQFVKDLPPPVFYSPTIFSPNGDNINDRFSVKLKNNSPYSIGDINIYSRWGDLLWNLASTNSTSWNGRYQNSDVAPGVYMVLIEFERVDGKQLTVCRDVTVIR